MMQGELTDVSRETIDRLQVFASLVEKWTAKINLISKPSVSQIWDRHIFDSAQLFDFAPDSGKWVDLGSGGGFPAIVISILSEGRGGTHDVVMVESDQRKAVFLRTAVRELGLNATVIAERIESIPPLQADILSARALADLGTLLGFAETHLAPAGTAIFPKGETWEKEDQAARRIWSYDCDVIKSRSNPEAAILKIKEIARV